MNIIRDYVAEGSINRPGTTNSCESITIHETGNPKKGANAKAHAEYIKTITDQTSWHYTVDDKEIYQHLPDEEKSFHTSEKEANETSIAIELCVNDDGDFEKTKQNAIELVRYLMEKHNISIGSIFTHNYWTGKNCPENLLNEGWADFVADINEAGKKEEDISDPTEEETPAEEEKADEATSRLKSIPLWGGILATIYIVAKNWFGFEIPGWTELSTEILALLTIIFGVANNPTNKNGF